MTILNSRAKLPLVRQQVPKAIRNLYESFFKVLGLRQQKGSFTAAQKQQLDSIYHGLNPFQLRKH
jgi:hypothetical protein